MTFDECFEALKKMNFRDYTRIPEGKLYAYSETLHIAIGKIERQKFMRHKVARSGQGSINRMKKQGERR